MTTARTEHALILFATVLFGLAVRGGPLVAMASLVATAALAFSLFLTRDQGSHAQEGRERELEKRLLLAIIVFGSLGMLGWSPSSIGPTTEGLERLPGLVWLLIAVGIYIAHGRIKRIGHVAVVVIAVGLTLTIGSFHLAAAEGIGFDVLALHMRAAEALAEGVNPYTNAVEVPNGAPTAEPGDVISGYVYPPITAVSYSIGHWVLSDPRYTSLLSWAAFLAILGLAGMRNGDRHGLYVMLLMASIPGWPLVLRAAWTEPFSLALLAGAYVLWRRPAASGTLLGMALASKQYFAVTAPLLLYKRDGLWLKRVIATLAAIGVTVGAALVWNVGAFWSAAVVFHTSTPPRPDSANIVGLLEMAGVEWDPPTALTLGAGLVVAVLSGRVARLPATFMLAIGVTLAISFLVSSQAFANYWFLVTGLCGLTLWGLATRADTAVQQVSQGAH